MSPARERWLLGATVVLATGVPIGARALVRARTAGVAAQLTAANVTS